MSTIPTRIGQDNPVTIRLAQPHEHAQVDQLVAGAYAADYGTAHSSEDPSQKSAHRSELFDVWVAVDGAGTLLGSITTRRPGGPPLQEDAADDELDLRLLAVSPQARRRGIATALVRHVEQLAQQSGARAVLLKTAPHMNQAHRLYESLGYVREPARDGLWINGQKVLDLHTFTRSVVGSRTLELVRTLVRNGCTAQVGERANAAAIAQLFDALPVHIQHVEPAPNRATVIVTVPGTDPTAAPLTLLGHTDVVPVDREHWTKEPFGAEISDGKIWGRGTADMLGLTAAMAHVTRALAAGELGGRPRGTLQLVAVADEEARGGWGARWIAQHHPELVNWDNCLSEIGGAHLPTADGSDAIAIITGEKGVAQRRLTVQGDAGHGSLPWHRLSAVARIGQVAARIAALELPTSHDQTWRDFVAAFRFDPATEQALQAGTDSEAYTAFGDLAAYAHAASHLTIAETGLHAGTTINVLPGHATLELDIRTLPGQSDDDVDALLRTALGELSAQVHIERLISEPATQSRTNTPLYRAITDAVHAWFPHARTVPTLFVAGSDLRFARHLGGLGYGIGLFGRQTTLGSLHGRLHGHDEFLDLSDLELTVRALTHVVTNFLDVTPPGDSPTTTRPRTDGEPR